MDKINCSACGAFGAERHRRGCPVTVNPLKRLEYHWNFETPTALRVCSECGITIDEGSQHKSDCSFGLKQVAYLAAHPHALIIKSKRMSEETWQKIRDEAERSGRGIIVEGCEIYYSILNAPSGPYCNGNFGKVPLSP
jgi:hypothetical protein